MTSVRTMKQGKNSHHDNAPSCRSCPKHCPSVSGDPHQSPMRGLLLS